jgi:uncharacterized repeat protein (TIGR01451 family)
VADDTGSGGSIIVNNSTITGNSCATDGGGIEVATGRGGSTTITVTNSTVSNNRAGAAGGGINTDAPGSISVTSSTVSGNIANGGGGGGIANVGRAANITVMQSVISGNQSTGFGAGIDATTGTQITISDSQITNNSAQSDGGGLNVDAGAGQNLTITNTTIDHNTSLGNDGGGFFFSGSATSTLTNCTVAFNVAGDDGGGVRVSGGLLTLTNCTVNNNSTGPAGGGGLENSGGAITIGNCVVANNFIIDGSGGVGPDLNGTFTSINGNFVGDTTGATIAKQLNDQFFTGNGPSPQLGPLTNNGGTQIGDPRSAVTIPTEANLGGATSPLIDKGSPAASVTTDERGSSFPRPDAPEMGTPDVGAFEVQDVADLQVTKSGPSTVTAGTDITYTITLTNKGPGDAQNVSLTDAVPAGTSFISATPVSGHNPDGFSYSQSAGTVTGTPTGGVVANGHQDEFTLVVHALSSDANGSTISNTANVTTDAMDDSAANDETATFNSTVAAVADLVVSKSGPTTVTAGTDVTYTITLTNAGPSDAQGVSLTDVVPTGTTFFSATPVSGQNPDGFSYSQSAGTVTGTPTGGVVANGHQDQFTLVVHALSSDADGSTISNTATVTTTTTDDSAANDETETVNSTVTAVADLVVTQSQSANPTEGQNLTLSITVTNNGPSDAQNVMLTDAVPAGTSFVSSSFVSYTAANTTVSLGAIAAGGQVTGTIVVRPTEEGSVTNTATVASATGDDSAANDETTTATINVADPQITASGGFTINAVENQDTGVQTVATLSDPGGSGDTDYTATINWGDNSAPDTATLGNGIVDTGPAGSAETFAVRGHHTYHTSGALTIMVTITHGALAPVLVSDSANVSGDVVVTDTTGGQTLTIIRTPGGPVGSITYKLGNSPPVMLSNVHSFTFNGQGANDSMTESLANGEPLVPGGIFFNAGPGATVLTLDAAGNPERSVPGALSGGDPQTLTYSNVGATNINNAASVVAIAGPDTADRGTAFNGLSAQERFVQAVYLDELGRAGSRSELDGWVALFNASGMSQAQAQNAIATGIEHSPEARDHLVKSWYVTFLGRGAFGGEEQGFVNALLSGQTEEQVLSGILASQEFFNRAQILGPGSSADEHFVQALYLLLLNRTGEASGVAGWVAGVPALGRQGVALSFLTGSSGKEFRTDQFEGYYNALMHRPDDPAGLNGWIMSNLDMGAVRIGFEASPEFFANG